MKTLEELEKLCEGATKGPWIGNSRYAGSLTGGKSEYDQAPIGHLYTAKNQHNAKFIAEARTALPRLIKQARVYDAFLEHFKCECKRKLCLYCTTREKIDLILEGKHD